MKTLTIIPLLIAALLFTVVRTALANDDKFVAAMKKNIASLYEAKTLSEYQEVINTLQRIAAAEKDRWEPHYYMGFGYVMMANLETAGTLKDQQLDRALGAIATAQETQANNSEIIALEGFVHMMRVAIDPASRGPRYSGLAMETFGKALHVNPDNPRALALMAQMQYGTAQFFGSSTAEACATLQKALENFNKQRSDNPLAPQWGSGMAEAMKGQCK